MLGHRAGFAAARIQALGDRLPHHLGIAHGRQRDEEDTVRGGIAERGGGRQGQPRLADAAGPGERQQPDVRRREGSAQPLKILDPADQRGGRHRQAGLGADALQRRERLVQARSDQLDDALWRIDVLEPVGTQVTDGQLRRQPRLRQLPRDVGHHHLTPVRRRHDPRPPVHVYPDVPVFVPGRFPRVQSHPGPDRDTAGPVMGGQRALRRRAAGHRIRGRLEHRPPPSSPGPANRT